MIVDSSVIVAIMRGEPDAMRYVAALERAQAARMPSPVFLEACMVLLNAKASEGLSKIRQALRELGVSVIPFTPEMADVAVAAFLQYGKGRGHKAQLNYVDCMSYAAAKVEVMPLLFKGDDFRHTDVESAL